MGFIVSLFHNMSQFTISHKKQNCWSENNFPITQLMNAKSYLARIPKLVKRAITIAKGLHYLPNVPPCSKHCEILLEKTLTPKLFYCSKCLAVFKVH